MDFLKLTHDPLSVDEVTSVVGDASCGAVSLFVGTTRDNFEGKIVCRLEYEAYNEMAEKEMKKICNECRTKWNVKNIAIYHRLGVVAVKESSVVVAVSSEHRRESLDAVSFLIDALKGSVPIWKREVYSDDKSEWKKNKECLWAKGGDDHNEKKDNVPKIKEEVMDTEEVLEDSFHCKEVERERPNRDQAEHTKRDEMDQQDGFVTPKRIKVDPEKSDPINEDKKESLVDSSLVQIVASKQEIERRIRAFQERKREELNVLNIQEFCVATTDEKEENSCARTTAVVLRSKGSSSHLKFTKVFNEWGPQTSGVDPGSLLGVDSPAKVPKHESGGGGGASEKREAQSRSSHLALPPSTFSGKQSEQTRIPEGVAERLVNMEMHLHGKSPTNPSIYARIKALEDRILFLEGISPEYFSSKAALPPTPRKNEEIKATADDMTVEEVEARIFKLRKQLKQRQLGITL